MPQRTKLTEEEELQKLKEVAEHFRGKGILMIEKHERAKAFWAEYERLEKEGTLYKK